MVLRDATPTDFDAILALNEESVGFLSPLTPARLARLHGQAALHRVVEEHGRVVAFLLAFREGAVYDSPNYQWFAARFDRFLYVDRVVVARDLQGHGLGARLYRDLFERALADGVPVVTAEYDLEPPNQVSARFHEGFGFREVGRQWVAGGAKLVSLQAVAIGSNVDGGSPLR